MMPGFPKALAALVAAFSLSVAGCGEDEGKPDAGAAKAEAKKAEPKAGEAAGDAGVEKRAADGGVAPEKAAKDDDKEKAKTKDEFLGTADELQGVAEALEQRRQALDLREREIIQREQLLEGLELAAVQKTEQLKALESEASAILDKLESRYEDVRKTYDDERKERATALKDSVEAMAAEREDRTVQLVASLKGMRPSAGAGLLSSMNEDDAVDVLRRLSARQSAALLGEMPPKKAADLAEAMIGPKLPSADAIPDVSEPPAPAAPASPAEPKEPKP
jgi:flagellar motility protein MotE (MotC chaperone)